MNEPEPVLERLPASARIDSHVCLWDSIPDGARQHVGFPGEDRTYLPEHLRAILERSRFDAAVLVTAGSSEAERAQAAAWVKAHSWLWGVVAGWSVSLPESAPVASLQQAGKLRGVWAAMPARDGGNAAAGQASPTWQDALAWTNAQRLPLELQPMTEQIQWEALPSIAEATHGALILCDLAGAPAGNAPLGQWMEAMRVLAAWPRVYVKVGGLYRSPTRAWPVSQLAALFQFLLDTLGPERLLFGSGWPYCLPHHAWKECLARFTQAIGPRDQALREQLLGANARCAYTLPCELPAV